MDDGLKQRIVGALVLLALLVIFLPVLFDRNRVEPVDQASQIPPAVSPPPAPINPPVVPNVAEADMAPPPAQMLLPNETEAEKSDEVAAQIAKIEAAKSDADKTAPKTGPKLTKTERLKPVVEAPELNKKGAAQAWVLQAASYKSATQAKKMRDDLAAKGFNAYVRELNTAKGPVARVFVGPKFDKAAVLEQKKRIDDLFKLNVLVLPYTPSN
jgi:DedD protein